MFMYLSEDIKWSWKQESQAGFIKLKSMLISDGLPCHFDRSRAVVIAADTSYEGVGAVIFRF